MSTSGSSFDKIVKLLLYRVSHNRRRYFESSNYDTLLLMYLYENPKYKDCPLKLPDILVAFLLFQIFIIPHFEMGHPVHHIPSQGCSGNNHLHKAQLSGATMLPSSSSSLGAVNRCLNMQMNC